MHATHFVEKSTDPEAWRKHSRALRRSADVLWDDFVELVARAVAIGKTKSVQPDFSAAIESIEIAKLLYGLALETALKAWLIEKTPEKVEIRLTMKGDGSPTQAELKSFGLPSNQGHNIFGLAEAAGVFGKPFASVIKTDGDRAAVKNICRDLGEVVVWRGRYPVPMASFDSVPLDPKGPATAIAHHLRDWLDPLLDALLTSPKSQQESQPHEPPAA
ncbi:hypothetical protein [Piscinibacter gummiphilus]|uniref:RiboL-PSP-HEPN domain-containing protein n=1 Tax=Piscinibacter gummiphilus TaxID=946333 RepID=A0ABZ0CVN3_9BURK|nr:hypothetical protein [Piscinibacter gummiphilus]WOB06928.1 hypothetical protein RXV79_18620 [Piscinibacter gummiphilus]